MSSKNSLEAKRLRREEREARKASLPKQGMVQKFIPGKDKYDRVIFMPVLIPIRMFK